MDQDPAPAHAVHVEEGQVGGLVERVAGLVNRQRTTGASVTAQELA